MAKSAARRWQGWNRQVAQNERVAKPGPKRKEKAQPFWLTIGNRDARCTECAKGLAHQPIAFHHPTKQVLCEDCWTSRGLTPRESRRYRDYVELQKTQHPENG